MFKKDKAKKISTFWLASMVLSGWIASSASATLLTFDTSDSQITSGSDNQGFYTSSGGSDASNDSYLLRTDTYRNFFSFDLSTLSSTIISATLELRAGSSNANLFSSVGNLEFFDVSTGVTSLNSGGNATDSPAIFTDLGTGNSYGSFSAIASLSNTLLSYTLNANAISDINTAAGNWFSLGGSLTGGLLNSTFFTSTDSGNAPGGIQRLILETVPLDLGQDGQDTGNTAPVPEPGTIILMTSGLLGVFAYRRKMNTNPVKA